MRTAATHNPAFMGDETLVDSFVIRQRVLNECLRVLSTGLNEGRPRHLLIAGKGGAGKTMLGLRLCAELRRHDALTEAVSVIVMPEELYTVGDVTELTLAIATHLAQQHDAPSLASWIQEIQRTEMSPGRMMTQLVARLHDWSHRMGRATVVFIEDLDGLLKEQLGTDSVRSLVALTERMPWMTLIGTSVERPECMDDALRRVFHAVELGPLGLSECRDVLRSISPGAYGPRSLEQVRPVHILTGGSARLVAMMGRHTGQAEPDLMADVLGCVRSHAREDREIIARLPVVERKVFAALADLWEPATARRVAQHSRLDVNRTSALLHRLVGRDFVEVVGVDKRAKLYQVADRGLNVFYLLRCEGSQAPRLRKLIRFMAVFYASDPLRALSVHGPEGDLLDAVRAAASCGSWDHALTRLGDALGSLPVTQGPCIASVVALAIKAAASGWVAATARALRRHRPWRESLEPMLVALDVIDQVPLSSEPPVEVAAVALDVVSIIRARSADPE